MSRMWKNQDHKIIDFENKIKIPNWCLDYVPHINLKKKEDFDKIQKGKGCYWIWTNEPIMHILHKVNNKKGKLPKKFNGGEIIYNGVTEGNVMYRIKHHLMNDDISEYRSGVSIDIYTKKDTKSHRKLAMSNDKKVPYLNGERINDKKQVLKLNLSQKEKQYIKKHKPPFFFRNGINIFDKKHKKYRYRVYYITGLKSYSYAEIIERKWRVKFGLPKLCSYESGR